MGMSGPVGGLTAAAAQQHRSTGSLDKVLAHLELLPVSADPKGWKSQGKSSEFTTASFWGGADSSQVQLMTACLAVNPKTVNPNPVEAAAQGYADPNSGETVSDTVEVYPNTSQAIADVAAAGNANIPNCVVKFEGANFTQGILQGFGKGATTSGTLAVTLRPLPVLGSHDAVEEMTLPVTFQGFTGTTYSDFVFVQNGRSESVLSFFSDGSRPSAKLVNRMADAAAAKMKST
jgi:hypothetical protein